MAVAGTLYNKLKKLVMVDFLSIKYKLSYQVIFAVFIFSIVFVFCLPLPTFGATMEITITLSSVQIPERSAMLLLSDRPNSEFSIPGQSRIVVVSKSGVIERWSWLEDNDGVPEWDIQKDLGGTFSFPYDATKAPYTVHVETYVYEQYTIICKADCTPVPANSGWYVTMFALSYYHIPAPYTGWYGYPFNLCPSVLCTAPDRGYLAIDPANVFNHYWRLPALLTIN